MKILHAAETIKGGVSTVMNSLIQHQIQKPEVEKIMVICPSDQQDNLIKIEKLNVYLFSRKKRNILGLISFMIIFTKILVKEKPDIVHLHSSFAGVIGRIIILFCLRLKKTKVIYCPHAFSFLMSNSDFKKKIFAYMELLLAHITDKIICVSNSEYNSAIQRNIPQKKLVIINNGVPVKKNLIDSNLNQKKIYKLIFVGRFDYQKGLDILLGSLTITDNKLFDFKIILTLIGESVNNNEEIEFPSNFKNIEINKKGWLKPKELENEYLEHDLLILPSRWEGFAMVPLEAMSYGLPIIASDIESFKEIINQDETGLLFKTESFESLSNILINLNTLNLNKIRDKSINTFKQKYTDNAMNESTFNLYLNMKKL